MPRGSARPCTRSSSGSTCAALAAGTTVRSRELVRRDEDRKALAYLDGILYRFIHELSRA
jgi:hypothetical protein